MRTWGVSPIVSRMLLTRMVRAGSGEGATQLRIHEASIASRARPGGERQGPQPSCELKLSADRSGVTAVGRLSTRAHSSALDLAGRQLGPGPCRRQLAR